MKVHVRIVSALAIAMCVILVSCNGSSSRVSRILAERDSLRVANEIQEKNLNSIAEMIDTINSVLDSITMEEGMLFLTSSKESHFTKSKALRDLERFEEVLRHQQNKIDELDSLLSSTDTTHRRSMEILISHLKIEISKKDVQIAKLRSELSNKNVDISKLRKEIENRQSVIDRQSETIDAQNEKIERQKTVIVRQDEMLNEGYVLIATRKELTDKGIMKKRKLLNERELDEYDFKKVDIRKCTELSFSAKIPRVITDMPKNSYEIRHSSGSDYVLVITNPSTFWSISNYLIVRTD